MSEQENSQATEAEAGWWGSVGESGVVSVTLRRRESGSEPFLEKLSITPETVPTIDDMEEAVKERHGGGSYVVVFPGDRGRFERRVQLNIAGLPKLQAAPKPEGEAGNLGAMLLQMQAASDARFEAMMERLDSRQGSGGIAESLGLIEQVASVLGKTGAAPAPQRSLAEQLREVRDLAEMMGIGAKPDDEDGFGWVKDLALQYGPALVAGMQGKGDTAPALPTPDAGADAQAEMLQRVRVLLRGMVQLAVFKVPPANTVETIQEQAGDAWPVLADFIARPDAVAMAASLVPAVSQHPEWFEGFRAAVIEPAPEAEKKTSGQAKKPAAKAKKAPA